MAHDKAGHRRFSGDPRQTISVSREMTVKVKPRNPLTAERPITIECALTAEEAETRAVRRRETLDAADERRNAESKSKIASDLAYAKKLSRRRSAA
jgi:hypothetical protein